MESKPLKQNFFKIAGYVLEPLDWDGCVQNDYVTPLKGDSEMGNEMTYFLAKFTPSGASVKKS